MAKKSKKKAKAASSRHRRTFTGVRQLGIRAHALALAHRSALEPRLPKGLLEDLPVDLNSLGPLVAGAQVSPSSHDSALEKVHARCVAFRHAVAKSDLPKSVRKGWGLGKRRDAHVVADVLFEADVILARADFAPHEAREAGILASDLDALRTDREAAARAEETHEPAPAEPKTRSRDDAAWRVIRAANRIAAAGVLEYATSRAERAPFDALRHAAGEHKDVLEAHGDGHSGLELPAE
jgi:hypothetical protein